VSVVTEQLRPAVGDLRLTRVLAALADPGRLAMVLALARLEESPCTALQRQAGLDISKSTFSHHQKILREAGVIRAEVRGAHRFLSLRRGDLDAAFPGLLGAVLETAPELTGI
jgi:DNA-binding transcriptional ArsR family regulator